MRANVLKELQQKLLSPQPAEKRISQYKLYHCEWEIGMFMLINLVVVMQRKMEY